MSATLTVRVARKWREAERIAAFELRGPDGAALPPFTPGAHVDVHLPGGVVRQYSLCGDPADASRYVIAVLLQEGPGSRAMHALEEGASVTIGGWYDPLYSYYRCGYRHDPFWRGGIATLYVGRYRGDYLRPPTTLVQQNTVINNITVNNSNNVNVNNVTMLTSLNDVSRGGGRNLRTLSAADRQSQQQAARSVRDVANRRAQLENEIAAAPRSSSSGQTRATPRASGAARS